jgi:3-oxoacyl-[acyl-carrier-protein] synthase II
MIENKKRIVITGLGAVTSIGIGWETFWKNLIKGKSGISEITSINTSDHSTHKGGEVKDFDPEKFIDKKRLKFMSRGTQLALSATKLAIKDAQLDKSELSRKNTSFCLGTTLGELPALERMDRQWLKEGSQAVDRFSAFQFPTTNMTSFVSLECKFRGPMRIFATACAAGNYSIGFGYDLLQSEEADIVLAGGADAFAWIPFTGFNQFRSVAPEKCQPFDKNRKGMMVGEGSGIVVLETLESALFRKAPIYAELLGYGLSCDAFHSTNTQMAGIYGCMADALKKTGVSKDSVDYICAHGTGTKQNDKAEAEAINKLFENRAKDIPVSSIKSMLGHSMGAASALETISCCLTVKDNIIPPTINYDTPDPLCNINCVANKARKQNVNIVLNNSFAFGGNNACVVVKKYENGVLGHKMKG